mmetsp:Transcript_31958/g.95441  ORF Transcript_31958/g.95441 Transcript_31958/m.95441 type:complete len:178 (-) Transcript_31958:273-806(-)
MSDLDRRDDATAAVAAAVSAAPSSHRHGQPAIAGQLRHPSPGRQGSLVQAGEPMPGGAAATAVAETAHPIGDGSGGGDGSWPAADAHCDGASASPIEDGGASATSEQKRATASQKPVVLKANKNSFLKGTGKGLPAPKKQKTGMCVRKCQCNSNSVRGGGGCSMMLFARSVVRLQEG